MPNLLRNELVVSAGSTFAVASNNGDIHPDTSEGLYAYDTRFLSTLRLTIQGAEPECLESNQFGHALASVYASSKGVRGLPGSSISIVRDRYVSQGLHEDIYAANHSTQRRSFVLEVAFDADFADVFEVRGGTFKKSGTVSVEEREGQHLCLVYRAHELRRETWIAFDSPTPPQVNGKSVSFHIELDPKERWKACMKVLPVAETPPAEVPCLDPLLGPPFGPYRRIRRAPRAPFQRVVNEPLPLEVVPRLETDLRPLQMAYDEAITDLRSLRLAQPNGHYILAAGIPWFTAIFGRDSIISSIQTKLLGPELMIGTLHTLASLQAGYSDDFRESDPGKIPHEVREGELSVLERVPHTRYYGSADATPLFVVLLWEAYQWTGDSKLLERLLPAAEAAVQWIDLYGDVDGDGFVEYHRRNPKGLRNQGWKDSGDSVSFKDGRLATGPIALAEVQGYAYEAKRRMADIYRTLHRDKDALRLEREAEALLKLFNAAFWMEDEGFFAIALDGKKRKVNSIASNPGHCLWSGIVEKDKAARVVERLMAPDMFSGWGIRTLSSESARFNPVSYHNGSVWPHDNSLIAAGMARYGFKQEARDVAFALIDAVQAFQHHRLPELFAGYARRKLSFPVSYPAANIPQAWACGALVYLLETLLGVIPSGDSLLREASPEGCSISMRDVPYRGTRRTL